MRNIAVFLDGTLNRSEGPCPTNVAKLFMWASSSTSKGDPQIKFYLPGVGVSQRLDKPSGLAGVGFQAKVALAYQFIGANFEPDSRIFVFGFSRGAYSARHLAGLIARVGILRKPDLGLAREAYDWYTYTVTSRSPRRPRPNAYPHTVEFLGLWDTVAAARAFVFGQEKEMHDPDLEAQILHVRHALARDERRYAYYPETYRGAGDHYQAKWFPGYHCDVGGGYAEERSLISNDALRWMVKEAVQFGFAVPPDFPWQCDSTGPGTPHECFLTRFVNRPRTHLFRAGL